ncbi:MAG: hypothetical protein OYG32_10995 [Rhodospirillaceae bacterium]|nr:hypothetical protein [Rhodospirillaceae bacterium]
MLQLVAVPAVLATIGSFALGYFVNEIATKSAYLDAYDKYTRAVEDSRGRLTNLVVDATHGTKEVERLKEVSVAEMKSLRNILDQARKMHGDMEMIHANAKVVYSADAFASLGSQAFEALAQDDNFVSAVTKETNVELRNLSAALRHAGDDWGPVRGQRGYGFKPWKHTDRSVSCSNGSYVTGIKVRYSGTCLNQCDADGGIVREILLTCHSVFD